MPSVDELFDQLEEQGIEAYAEEQQCMIDADTRTISVPPEYQLLGVENDKKVERLYFKCPKIVGDNIDLSTDFQLFICFENAGNEADAYHIDDMQVEGDSITFSWLLGEAVTRYQGNVQFAFCAIKPGEEGEPDLNRWNTTINDECTCLVGLKSMEIVEEQNADAIAQLWNEIKSLEQEEQNSVKVFQNAGSHNSIYRGKYLGSSVTQEQWNAIEAGTFDDLYIGDYWVIGGVTWLIAGFDYYYGCGDTAFNKHHAVIVPLSPLYKHAMNETNTTEGGYVGSLMYTEGLEQAKTQIQQAFGAEHVLSHRLLLTNTTTNGYASSGEWKDSIVDLMCETMVYGSMIMSPMNNGTNIPYNYRTEKGQLPLFQMAPQYTFNRSGTYWLRDVVSASYFANANAYGIANDGGASTVNGVRPAFCIGV